MFQNIAWRNIRWGSAADGSIDLGGATLSLETQVGLAAEVICTPPCVFCVEKMRNIRGLIQGGVYMTCALNADNLREQSVQLPHHLLLPLSGPSRGV